jgi:general secretion pathway protein J
VRARGFSLIEVLLAMTLLALLIAGAFTGIRTATRATERGEAAIERTNKTRVAQEFLRRQISHALAMPYSRVGATGELISFGGDREVLTFVAPMPGYFSRGGPYVQSIALESERGGGRRLVFRHAMLNGYDLDGREIEEVEPVVLYQGIREGRIEYRGIDDFGRLEEWTDRWDRKGRTPVMVRVMLEFERGSGIAWPELVIPLRVDAAAAAASLEPTFFGQPR